MCLKLCTTKRVKIKDGRTLVLRRPRISDVNQLKAYVNSLVDEDAMILVNERQSLKSEQAWLKDLLRKIRKNELHAIVAEHEGKIIGSVELRKKKWRQSHIAEIGISVKKNYRRLGVGTALMKTILEIGKKDKKIKLIYLTVYDRNKAAEKMYEKLGFKQVARLKNRVQYKGKLGDEFVMDYVG